MTFTTFSSSFMKRTLHNPYFWIMALLAVVLVLGMADASLAKTANETGGGDLPWESPIKLLTDSISGPVAFGVALLGLVVCGAMLIWGGEISEFVRRIVYVVLVVCIIVFAKNLLTGQLFSGAIVPDDLQITAQDIGNFSDTSTSNQVGTNS